MNIQITVITYLISLQNKYKTYIGVSIMHRLENINVCFLTSEAICKTQFRSVQMFDVLTKENLFLFL